MGVPTDEQAVSVTTGHVVDLQGLQLVTGGASVKAVLEYNLPNLQRPRPVLLVWQLNPLAELGPPGITTNLDHVPQC